MPCPDIAACHELQVKAPLYDRLLFTKQLLDEGRYKKKGLYSLIGLIAAIAAWVADPATVLPGFLMPYADHIKTFWPLLTIVLGWFTAQGAPIIPTTVPVSMTAQEQEGQ